MPSLSLALILSLSLSLSPRLDRICVRDGEMASESWLEGSHAGHCSYFTYACITFLLCLSPARTHLANCHHLSPRTLKAIFHSFYVYLSLFFILFLSFVPFLLYFLLHFELVSKLFNYWWYPCKYKSLSLGICVDLGSFFICLYFHSRMLLSRISSYLFFFLSCLICCRILKVDYNSLKILNLYE